MFHMDIAFKENVFPWCASKARTLFHNIYNSSIKGFKYTSTFPLISNSLLGIIKASIRK
jgi:hypothetical protein